MLHADGWYLAATRGSHRQYKHPAKPGRVTVPGKPSDDLDEMEFAYIISADSMAEVARSVRDVAFTGYQLEERYGLNVGEGQYFKIARGDDVAILCSSDYGDPPAPEFNFLAYLWRSDSARLANVAAALAAAGFSVLVGPA